MFCKLIEIGTVRIKMLDRAIRTLTNVKIYSRIEVESHIIEYT